MIDLTRNGDDEIKVKVINTGTFTEDVSRIKEIQGRKWDPASKVWVIPADQLDALTSVFDKKEIIWNMHDPKAKKKAVQIAKFDVDNDHLDTLKLPPYDFQIIGINFLSKIKRCLLGDEMGIGKSLQAIGAAYKLYKDGKASKCLVLCPASIKYQWGAEVEKFTDLSYVVVDGDKTKRQNAYYSDAFFVIVNYELLLRDIEDISGIFPDIIVCDEIHRIKNWKAQTSKNILKLDAEYKWGLTGTPLQNKPEEIYNVFAFLEPSVLGNFWTFRKHHIVVGEAYGRKNVPIGVQHLDELHTKLTPFMLRRLKKDVAKDLPEIIYTTKYIEMSKDQSQINKIIFKDFESLMEKVESLVERDEFGDIVKKPPEADKALGYFILLQEIADSMELLSMSDSKMAVAYDAKSKDSPKLDELYEICKEKLENDPDAKIVIFTQFERMQRLIEAKLNKLGKAALLNGKLKPADKQKNIENFKTNKDVRFFISTDSGNYGVNLENSDTLINVDIPWNPSIFDQRNARIHRLTSTFENVEIITLLSKDSIDDVIYKTMYKKKAISSKVVEYTDEEKEQLEKISIRQLKSLFGR
ncbi:MAG TPA: DEAD/DEAH box helicase [Pseudoneobacillus sp.]|nr:DEAD/DEAH box helicase [Pseudoneobacillus sp.]